MFVYLFINTQTITAQSYLIDFPTVAESLTACNSDTDSSLTVKLSDLVASSSGSEVIIELPAGVTYVPGYVLKTGGNLLINESST